MEWRADLDDDPFAGPVSEHITIKSEPVEEDAVDAGPSVANYRFAQRSKSNQISRAFVIYDDCFLEVRIEQPRRPEKRYRFNLAFLDPAPRRLSGIAYRWLYVSVVLAAVSAMLFGVNWMSDTPLLQQRELWISTLFAASTVVAFLVFVSRTHLTLSFRSLHGRVPLVDVAARTPRRSAVEQFVAELQKRIEVARGAQWQDKRQFLCDELRAHHRLWNEGILPDETYEAGKRRILAAHE